METEPNVGACKCFCLACLELSGIDWGACAIKHNYHLLGKYEDLGKYLIHSLNSGDFGATAKKKKEKN